MQQPHVAGGIALDAIYCGATVGEHQLQGAPGVPRPTWAPTNHHAQATMCSCMPASWVPVLDLASGQQMPLSGALWDIFILSLQ